MPLNANKVPAKKSNIEVMAPGTYPAILAGIVDLGLQAQKPYNGQERHPVYEIVLTYEFVGEFLNDEDGNPDESKPRHLSERIPIHNLKAKKAKSTKRYYALDPEEKHEGDFVKLVGTPCTVTVVHNPKKGSDDVYVNISNVSSPIKGYPYPPLKNDPKVFNRDHPDMTVWEKLPEWIQRVIKEGLDFHSTELAKKLNYTAPASAPAPAPKQLDMDDAPF